MSEQPQDDHKLCIRLARLCGIKVVPRDTPLLEGIAYPCIIYGQGLIFLRSPRDSEPWNPLEDERQAFRYVDAAMSRRDCSLRLNRGASHHAAGIALTAEYLKGSHFGETLGGTMAFYANVARPICLAALEAWEKLEERDAR